MDESHTQSDWHGFFVADLQTYRGIVSYHIISYGCVWKLAKPLNPMVFMIIIPITNGYFIGNIPYFQTNPYHIISYHTHIIPICSMVLVYLPTFGWFWTRANVGEYSSTMLRIYMGYHIPLTVCNFVVGDLQQTSTNHKVSECVCVCLGRRSGFQKLDSHIIHWFFQKKNPNLDYPLVN